MKHTLPESEIVDRYNRGQSRAAIAFAVGSNITTIKKVLVKHKVKLRTYSEQMKIQKSNESFYFGKGKV